MSDTATNGSLDAFLLDGDAPRLGAPVPMQPTILDHEQLVDEPVAGLHSDIDLPSLPTPSLPTPTPAMPATAAEPGAPSSDGAADSDPRHPMAHLMGGKMQPSEGQLRAAQMRAEMKKKSRRNSIIVGVIALAVAALAGPPLLSWTMDAINDAGTTKEETPTPAPATTAPAAAASTVPASQAPATSAPAGLLGLPGQAEAVVGQVNGTTPATAPVATAAPAAPAPTAAP